MKNRRVSKINSLLREVFSEVIRVDFDRPSLTHLLTVTDVEITNDLQHAKVFISVIGNEETKKKTIDLLNHARGYLAILASKKVRLRYFPEIYFKLDDGVERQMRIEELLKEVKQNDSPEDSELFLNDDADDESEELSDDDADDESERLSDDDADDESEELSDHDADEESEELSDDDADDESEELSDDDADDEFTLEDPPRDYPIPKDQIDD